MPESKPKPWSVPEMAAAQAKDSPNSRPMIQVALELVFEVKGRLGLIADTVVVATIAATAAVIAAAVADEPEGTMAIQLVRWVRQAMGRLWKKCCQ